VSSCFRARGAAVRVFFRRYDGSCCSCALPEHPEQVRGRQDRLRSEGGCGLRQVPCQGSEDRHGAERGMPRKGAGEVSRRARCRRMLREDRSQAGRGKACFRLPHRERRSSHGCAHRRARGSDHVRARSAFLRRRLRAFPLRRRRCARQLQPLRRTGLRSAISRRLLHGGVGRRMRGRRFRALQRRLRQLTRDRPEQLLRGQVALSREEDQGPARLLP
jgi:hypothetical protein